jgi:hypothetical protein
VSPARNPPQARRRAPFSEALLSLLAAALGCSSTPAADPAKPQPTTQPTSPPAPIAAPWVERFGGVGQQASAPAVDAAGDVVVTGSFFRTLDFGGNPLTAAPGGSLFLAKLDPTGHALWSEEWQTEQEQASAGHAVVTDGQGNILLAGLAGPAPSRRDIAPEGGFFVAKLDPSGHPVWQNPLLSAYDRFNLTVNGGGFAMLSARIPSGLYVEMVDPSGAECWNLSFPIACASGMTGIAANGGGALVLTGFYDCPVDFGGGPLASNGRDSVFVASFDSSGDFLWSRGVGAEGGSVTGQSVALDDAGNVFVAGDYSGSPDFGDGALPASQGGLFLAALGPTGATVWSHGYDQAASLGSAALALCPAPQEEVDGAVAKRVYLLGSATGPVDFGPGAPASGGPGAFILELTAAGAFSAVHGFVAKSPSSSVQGGGVAVGANGALAFAGLLSGTVDFGGTTLESTGPADVVVGHLVP